MSQIGYGKKQKKNSARSALFCTPILKTLAPTVIAMVIIEYILTAYQ